MRPSTMRFLTVSLGAIGLSCLLGLCVDFVTAHVAVEYFTLHHPRIVSSESPTIMAIVWGIGASWWFGAIAGLIVASINERRVVPLEAFQLLKWIAVACAAIWMAMMAILVAVLVFASTIPVEMRRPTFDLDRRLMAVALAHQFEYYMGAIALLIIAVKTWRHSNRKSDSTSQNNFPR